MNKRYAIFFLPLLLLLGTVARQDLQAEPEITIQDNPGDVSITETETTTTGEGPAISTTTQTETLGQKQTVIGTQTHGSYESSTTGPDGTTRSESVAYSETVNDRGTVTSQTIEGTRSTEWDAPWGKKTSTTDGGDAGADDAGGKKTPPEVATSVKLYENKTQGETEAWKKEGKQEYDLGPGSKLTTEGKIQAGQAGGEAGVTGAYDPTTGQASVEVVVKGEANLVKVTAGGKVVTEVVPGVNLEAEVKTTGTVGVEGEGGGKVSVGPDGVEAEGKVAVFAGAKVKAEGSGTLDLSDWLGLKFTGKVEGEASAGAGAEASGLFAIKDGKIKIGGKLAATLGLGGGLKGSVEIDATPLINTLTGKTMDDAIKSGNRADIVGGLIDAVKTGQLTMPPGTKFSGLATRINDLAQQYVDDPSKIPKGPNGEILTPEQAIAQELGFPPGPNAGPPQQPGVTPGPGPEGADAGPPPLPSGTPDGGSYSPRSGNGKGGLKDFR